MATRTVRVRVWQLVLAVVLTVVALVVAAAPLGRSRADVNGDGRVDVVDVQLVVNEILAAP